MANAGALGFAPLKRFDDNDAHGLFAALGDLVVGGPTVANVNFRAILIEATEQT